MYGVAFCASPKTCSMHTSRTTSISRWERRMTMNACSQKRYKTNASKMKLNIVNCLRCYFQTINIFIAVHYCLSLVVVFFFPIKYKIQLFFREPPSGCINNHKRKVTLNRTRRGKLTCNLSEAMLSVNNNSLKIKFSRWQFTKVIRKLFQRRQQKVERGKQLKKVLSLDKNRARNT